MKAVVLILNLALLGFTVLVTITDGPATTAPYIFFNLWLLLTLVFSPVAVWRTVPSLKVAAMACNAILLGFICWALIDQYPHPAEEGLVPFIVMMFLVPVVNLLALMLGLRRRRVNTDPVAGVHFGLTL